MKITFVRHAEVIEEYIGKYNGHIDIPISQNGKKQAKELAKRLKDIKFDKIYCSDLLRAKQTLELFELNQEVIYSEQLREKSWGKHEGKSFDDILNEGIEYKNFQQWISDLDGEDIASYKNRVKKYLNDAIFKDKSKNILIVTHSGFIKTFISIIDKISIEESFRISLPYASFLTFNKQNMTIIYNKST